MIPPKKKKKSLIIISISIGVALILLAIVYGISLILNNPGKYMVSEDFVGSLSQEMAYPETSDYSGEFELDASNYDEANTESKIRKVGSVNITVDDIDVGNDSVTDIFSKYNGTVVSSSVRGEGNDKTLTVTLKVPVEYFEDIYEKIQDIDGEITYASYYTDDVTQEYTDLESRLRNLEVTESQLIKILNTATTVEDTLSVYTQLSSTRSQIELIKGQLKYLDNQVDYSYLTVNLSLSDVGKDVSDEQWKPFGIVKTAFSALLGLGIFIVDLLIWLVVFSPVIAVIVIIVVLLRKRAKNKK